MRATATRKRRGTSIDFDLDKQPNRRETAKRRSGAGFKRKSACPSRAPGTSSACFFSKVLGRAFCGDIPEARPLHPGPTHQRNQNSKETDTDQSCNEPDSKTRSARPAGGGRAGAKLSSGRRSPSRSSATPRATVWRSRRQRPTRAPAPSG